MPAAVGERQWGHAGQGIAGRQRLFALRCALTKVEVAASFGILNASGLVTLPLHLQGMNNVMAPLLLHSLHDLCDTRVCQDCAPLLLGSLVMYV